MPSSPDRRCPLRYTALFLPLILAARVATAAVAVDLATTYGDWVAWAGEANDSTGRQLAIGDVNGDGIPDLVLEQEGWTQGPVAGRVCIYFGPLALPSEHDLLAETPPTCILAAGWGIRLADVDGDGIRDVIVGNNAPDSPASRQGAGTVLVFRGRPAWPAEVQRDDADWAFSGVHAHDQMLFGDAADVNGDGAPDLVLGAPEANGPALDRQGAGEVYIVFGPASRWKSVMSLDVDPPDVTIYGADGLGNRNPGGTIGDHLGGFSTPNRSGLVLADLLGDAKTDLILSAGSAAGPANADGNTGEVIVLAGRAAWPAVIDLRSYVPDLIVYGETSSGLRAGAAGDFDADGRPDLILGGGGGSQAGGAVYVLRGGSTLAGAWDLAQKPADEKIVPPPFTGFGPLLGGDIALGDVNGDGWIDIVAGATADKTPYNRRDAGAVYVISGCPGLEPLRDLGVEPAEMAVWGAHGILFPPAPTDLGDRWGEGLAVGDVNGDGRADIFGGAVASQSLLASRGHNAGEAHVVLGRPFDASCSIAADAGPAVALCGEADVTLDASATVVTGCAKTPEYRWALGATTVRDWSADPMVTVRPALTSTYRIDVRCGDCTGVCTGSATVTIAVDADVTPPDLGNVLFAVRRGVTDVALSWAADPLARTYALHRATQKDSWPPAPLLAGLAAPAQTLPDLAPPPDLYFYRAAGASCSGREGP